MSSFTLNSNTAPSDASQPSYTLCWKLKQLIVRAETEAASAQIPVSYDRTHLAECLERSLVQRVRLDPALGKAALELWANACHQANKSAFLHIPSAPSLPHRQKPFLWRLKRAYDWLVAIVLLLMLSPVLLAIALLVKASSPGPVFFRQWRVGERGKLFQIYKFRSMIDGADRLHHTVMANQNGLHKLENDPRVTPIGHWLRKYSLDELPQLFNVVRGEMSLVGPRPWALYDALRIEPSLRHRLNALPGMTGAWQVQARSHLLDLSLVNQHDLAYLQTWSIGQDLKFLLMTIPKVLSGFGAF